MSRAPEPTKTLQNWKETFGINKAVFFEAAGLLVQGISELQVGKKTGLSRWRVAKVKRWLKGRNGQEWTTEFRKTTVRKATVLGRQDEQLAALVGQQPTTVPDPGVISITIHGGTIQITGQDHRGIWKQLKSMVDAYFG